MLLPPFSISINPYAIHWKISREYMCRSKEMEGNLCACLHVVARSAEGAAVEFALPYEKEPFPFQLFPRRNTSSQNSGSHMRI